MNLAKPPKEATANAGRLCEVLPFLVTGKSKMRIVGAAKLVNFYKTISRPLDPSNMTWTVIKNFLEQQKALKERKSRLFDDTRIPKITKTLPVCNWIQSVNSLTPICVRAGIKNYCSVEFLRRNSTFFRVFRHTKQPPTTPTMVSRSPLLWCGLDGYAQSNTRATHPRMSARALSLGFV